MDSKHIVLVLSYLKLGGSEKKALQLAEYLIKQGNRVSIVGLADGGVVKEMCEQLGIACYTYQKPRWIPGVFKRFLMLRQFFNFYRFLAPLKPDIILSYCMDANIFCGMVWYFTFAKKLIWNQEDIGLQIRDRMWATVAAKLSSVIVNVSETALVFSSSFFNVSDKKLRVIYNGIPPIDHSATENWREKLSLSPDCFVATMVGNLLEVKDYPTLLKAWAEYDRKVPNKEKMLLICGRLSSEKEKLDVIIQDHGIADKVIFLGSIKDVQGVLTSSDLFLFTSKSEGLGLAVVEAMMAGLPVLATNIPALQEVLGEKYSDFMFEVGDYKALANLVVKLFEDVTICECYSDFLLKRASELFTIDQFNKNILKEIV